MEFFSDFKYPQVAPVRIQSMDKKTGVGVGTSSQSSPCKGEIQDKIQALFCQDEVVSNRMSPVHDFGSNLGKIKVQAQIHSPPRKKSSTSRGSGIFTPNVYSDFDDDCQEVRDEAKRNAASFSSKGFVECSKSCNPQIVQQHGRGSGVFEKVEDSSEREEDMPKRSKILKSICPLFSDSDSAN